MKGVALLLFGPLFLVVASAIAVALRPDNPDALIAGAACGYVLGSAIGGVLAYIKVSRDDRRVWDNYRKTWWKNGGSLRRSVGCVYFIRATRGRYKIGRTKDIEARVSELQTANHERLSVELVIPTDEPEVMERWLHKKYERKRMGGEWFALSRRDMRWVIGEVEKAQQQQMAQHT